MKKRRMTVYAACTEGHTYVLEFAETAETKQQRTHDKTKNTQHGSSTVKGTVVADGC